MIRAEEWGAREGAVLSIVGCCIDCVAVGMKQTASKAALTERRKVMHASLRHYRIEPKNMEELLAVFPERWM